MANPNYNPDTFLPEIHAWIESGKTLRSYCRQEGKPPYSVVYDWLEEDIKRRVRFARARDIGEEQIAQELLEIADNPIFGEIVTEDSEGKRQVRRMDMVEHRKLMIETRLKLLKIWNPRKYGEKLEHSGPEGGPIVFQVERIGPQK